ncbi:MAG: thioesterase family protein [Myxococcota bacterium]
MHGRFTPDIEATLAPVVTARILYADTDRMGIVYHASFFRYLELARIELLRGAGISYVQLEKLGLGLPLIEVGVRFIKPALYDDLITIHAGLSLVTRVRVSVQYRVVVEPGGREDTDEPVEILTAETRHCCVEREDPKPARLPLPAFELLVRQWKGDGPAPAEPLSGGTDRG